MGREIKLGTREYEAGGNTSYCNPFSFVYTELCLLVDYKYFVLCCKCV